jgi:hypothetical protein
MTSFYKSLIFNLIAKNFNSIASLYFLKRHINKMDAFDDPSLFPIKTGHNLDGLHLMKRLSTTSPLQRGSLALIWRRIPDSEKCHVNHM